MLLISLCLVVLGIAETHGVVIPILPSQVSSSSAFTFGSIVYGPEFAVDGGFDTNFITGNTTFASDVGDRTPYMDIDLGGIYSLLSVTITNRGDCCSERLRNIIIEVYDEDPTLGGTPEICATVGSISPAASSNTTYACLSTTIGRYVRLYKFTTADDTDLLQLVEVVLDGILLECPCNHFQLEESCFYFSGFQTTYAQAKEYCNIFESNLAMIRTQAQDDFVNSILMSNAIKGQKYWIGVTNLFDRYQWRYLAGDVVPLNNFTFPLVNGTTTCSNSTSSAHPENCASLELSESGRWEWEDERCNREEYFLCLALLDTA